MNPVAKALDNFSITDVFFDIQNSGSEPETNDLVTLVDMTALHSRGDIANLLEDINQTDPLYVGVDLIFEGEKDDVLGNEILEGAVGGLFGKSLFSLKLTDYDSSQGTFTNSVRSFFAERVEFDEAYTNLNDDMAGVCIRDFSVAQTLNGERVLSFPAKIASVYDESIASLDNNEVLINFKNVRFPVVMYDEINQKSDLIEGHIVLVGTMTEEQDMHNTPLGKMPGLELQAYSLLTLLEHKGIKEVPSWLSWIIAFLLCYFLELSIDAVIKLLLKYDKTPIIVFLRKSNVVVILMLFLWITIVCWIMFLMFVKHGISIQGGIILGLMALVCEGRNLVYAIVKAITAKKPNCWFVRTSLLNYDD